MIQSLLRALQLLSSLSDAVNECVILTGLEGFGLCRITWSTFDRVAMTTDSPHQPFNPAESLLRAAERVDEALRLIQMMNVASQRWQWTHTEDTLWRQFIHNHQHSCVLFVFSHLLLRQTSWRRRRVKCRPSSKPSSSTDRTEAHTRPGTCW